MSVLTLHTSSARRYVTTGLVHNVQNRTAQFSSTTFRRSHSTHADIPKKPRSRTPLYLVLTLLAGGVVYTKSLPSPTPSPSLAKAPLSELIRSYAVWSLISFPSLVDVSPALLDFTFKTSIPLIRPVGDFVIRNSFFPQFIPGETAEECLPGLQEMRRRNVGHALNYSAEGDTLELQKGKKAVQKSPEEMRFGEVERALDVQGEFERQMAEEGWAKGSSAFALKVVSDKMPSERYLFVCTTSGAMVLFHRYCTLQRLAPPLLPADATDGPHRPTNAHTRLQRHAQAA